MSGWSDIRGGIVEAGGAQTAASDGKTITSGSANVEGAWSEMIASTLYDSDWLYVQYRSDGSQNNQFLTDVGVGGAGGEKEIVENLHSANKGHAVTQMIFPIHIPAGTRIAMRCQANGSSKPLNAVLAVASGSFLGGRKGLSKGYAYGDDAADSGGTSIDPGATANTKPATFTTLDASTGNPIQWLYIMWGTRGNAAMALADWLFDIAVGTATNEEIVVADAHVRVDATENISPRCAGPFPVNIPAGTRLSTRSQCTITDATDRLLDVVVIGVA